MPSFRPFVLIVAIFLLCNAIVNAALTPFENTVTNPCNGETIVVSGFVNTVITDNVFHINLVGVKGIGDQGTRYVITQHVQLSGNVSPGATVSTSELNLGVISMGSANNFILHSIVHTTTTAKGPTSEIIFIDSKCV